jgi:uncharacterized protein YndB with AHSA1/START domain
MVQPLLHVERLLDFPVAIVWDALTDSVLLSGWLAEVEVDLRIGGRFDLQWLPEQGIGTTYGEIAELDDGVRLRVETSTLGLLTFDVAEERGGTRGTSTLLRITVAAQLAPAQVVDVVATLTTSLDQLVDLLYGHPVDWRDWMYDWHATWLSNRPRPVRRVT